MTQNENTVVEGEIVEEPKKKFALSPVAKKVLKWSGAAVGVIAAGLLISKVTNSGAVEGTSRLEDDTIEIVSHEDGSFTVKEVSTEE